MHVHYVVSFAEKAFKGIPREESELPYIMAAGKSNEGEVSVQSASVQLVIAWLNTNGEVIWIETTSSVVDVV